MAHLAPEPGFEPTTDYPLTSTTSCLFPLLRLCLNIDQQLVELAKTDRKRAQSLNPLSSPMSPAEHKGKDPGKACDHASLPMTACSEKEMRERSWTSPCASLPEAEPRMEGSAFALE